jgi:hypothetical protein
MLLTPSSLDQTTSILKRIAIRLAERERQALAELCILLQLKYATEAVAQNDVLGDSRARPREEKTAARSVLRAANHTRVRPCGIDFSLFLSLSLSLRYMAKSANHS